jgi:uncharacterized protein
MNNNRASVILLSRKDDGQVDFSDQCNCACVNSGFSGVVPNGGIVNYTPRRAVAYVQELPKDNKLLFNLKSGGDIAILNPSAFGLWEQFQQHHSPDYYIEHSPFITTLMASGLLVLPHTKVVSRTARTLTVWLHVTNDCNLRCDYCYLQKTSARMNDEIGYSAIDAVLRSALEGNFKRVNLKFSGGEATLNIGLVFKLHAYAQKKALAYDVELDAVILSNGIAFSRSIIDRIKARGIKVMISVDGVNNTQNIHRRISDEQGSFIFVERTINNLLARGITPFISITLTPFNLDGLPSTISYVLDRNLPFNINFFRDNDCATIHDGLASNKNRVVNAIRDAFKIIQEKLPAQSLLGEILDRSQFVHPRYKTCGVGESYLVIDHLGQVSKCHMDMENPITNISVINPLRNVRDCQLGFKNVSVDEKEGCRDCQWRYWCAGGCPLETYRTTGRYDVKSPNCSIYQALFPEILRLEGLRLLKYQDDPEIVQKIEL